MEEEKAIVLSSGCDDFVRKLFREHTIFETMAKHLDIEIASKLIAEIPVSDCHLAMALTEWIDDFKFEEILELLD